MFHTLLVPLDGSMAAEHALPWALSIAQQDGVALHLVRVHNPPAPMMVGSELIADIQLEQTIRQIEEEYLRGLVNRLSAMTTVPVRHALLDGGPAEAIDDYAAGIGADLMVMTSHGHSAFARFWLGSVADRVIRHSRTPILLVRADSEQAADFTTRPFVARIVIPLDGSELAESAVGHAVKLGKATGAEFALLHVLTLADDQAPGSEVRSVDAAGAKAEAYLEKISRRLRAESLLVNIHVVRASSTAGGILDFAQTHGNYLIATATHGRSGLKRLILGSVADKVIRGATMPVLIYHPMEPT